MERAAAFRAVPGWGGVLMGASALAAGAVQIAFGLVIARGFGG